MRGGTVTCRYRVIHSRHVVDIVSRRQIQILVEKHSLACFKITYFQIIQDYHLRFVNTSAADVNLTT